MTEVERAKWAARKQVWARLEREHAAPPGVHGRIPAFFGADRAADRLASLPVWQTARVLKAVPDSAQEPVRARALRDGKVVYMAVPKLAEARPFYLLDPRSLAVSQDEAASKGVAARVAPQVGVEDMTLVDMIVCGSMAVNRGGVRLGKGAGYSDIEVALLQEAGLIGPRTTIVTTVHQLQVVDDDLPETEHDFGVDLIVTPDEVIRSGRSRRPCGLIWADLDAAKIAAIPVLAARLRARDVSADQ